MKLVLLATTVTALVLKGSDKVLTKPSDCAADEFFRSSDGSCEKKKPMGYECGFYPPEERDHVCMAGLSCKQVASSVNKMGAGLTCRPGESPSPSGTTGCSADHDCTDPVTCVSDVCCEQPCGQVTVEAGATASVKAVASTSAEASHEATATATESATAEATVEKTATAEETATADATVEETAVAGPADKSLDGMAAPQEGTASASASAEETASGEATAEATAKEEAEVEASADATVKAVAQGHGEAEATANGYGKVTVEACADGDKDCDWDMMEKKAVGKAQKIANEEAIATATERAKSIALGGADAAAAQAASDQAKSEAEAAAAAKASASAADQAQDAAEGAATDAAAAQAEASAHVAASSDAAANAQDAAAAAAEDKASDAAKDDATANAEKAATTEAVMKGAGDMTGGLDQIAQNAHEQTGAAAEAHAEPEPEVPPRKQGF